MYYLHVVYIIIRLYNQYGCESNTLKTIKNNLPKNVLKILNIFIFTHYISWHTIKNNWPKTKISIPNRIKMKKKKSLLYGSVPDLNRDLSNNEASVIPFRPTDRYGVPGDVKVFKCIYFITLVTKIMGDQQIIYNT